MNRCLPPIMSLLLCILCSCSVQRSTQPAHPMAHGNPYLQRGYEFMQRDQWPQAIEEFRRAVELDPDSAVAHAALGWAYYRTGRMDLALQEGEEVLRLEPDNEQVRSLLELLRQQRSGGR